MPADGLDRIAKHDAIYLGAATNKLKIAVIPGVRERDDHRGVRRRGRYGSP